MFVPLATRSRVYEFPVLRAADWAVVNSRDDWLPDTSYLRQRNGIDVGVRDLYRQPQLMRRELNRLGRSSHWRLVYARDAIYVFEREQS